MGEAIQFGQYLLVKKLAAGGMAQVWLAQKPGIEGFQKNLVIKQVLTHLAGDESFVTMFLDEARLAADLNHPNVVQVFDLGQEDESYFIAMEYIHGEDLRRVDRGSRKARKPIPIELVCRVISDAAAGLQYAHSRTTPDGRLMGIVHRDISPQNIIVTFEGGVKVVDFGIAKAADRANKTRAGVLKGKYAYMSPEQATAKNVDGRTDVFALGILLHELLTGRRLFKREGDVATLHAVVSCEVDPPSLLNPVVPEELDPIVLSALARDPDERTPDAGTLQMQLEDFLLSSRLPASNAHLRSYMRDLFSERLEIEAREGGPAGYLVQRATGASGSMLGSSLSPSRRGDQLTSSQRPSRSVADSTPSSSVRISPTSKSDDPEASVGSRASSFDIVVEEPAPDTEEDSVSGSEKSVGSVTRLAETMKRRRLVAMVASLAVLGSAALAGVFFLTRGGEEGRSGEVPGLISGLGPTGERSSSEQDQAGSDESSPNGADDSSPDTGEEVVERSGAGDTKGVPDADTEPTVTSEPAPGPAGGQRKAAQRTGTLRAEVRPSGAQVRVRSGRGWRVVSGRGLSLTPGSHRIRVVLPDGATVSDSVDVVAGQARTYERSFAKGTLRVVIQPFGSGGEVKVRGRVVATVPGPPAELFEGRHEVEIVGRDGRRKTETVQIRPGAQTNLTVSFD